MIFGLTFLLCIMASPLLVTMDTNPGTTPHIQAIFIGRCWDYVEIKYKSCAPSTVDCVHLWDLFFKSFSYRTPCELDLTSYQTFMAASRQDVPENKAMFWSGTYQIAHEYAQASQRYVTLEDTLIGYLANGLVWCGQVSPPGMNASRCPSWTECSLESSESFWAEASKTFAKSVKGKATLVLDGSRQDKPAYSKHSFFAKYELISLGDISKVIILVTHTLGGPIKETCSNGSIVELKNDIARHGLQYDCIDDPPAIEHLLCADDPSARECQLVLNHMRSRQPALLPSWNLPSQNPDLFAY